jgi:ATP-dependent protease ClpP protease subunit
MRRFLAVLSGVLASLVVAGSVFATDAAVVDYSTNVATAVVGLVAGVAASIAAVFLIAALIRVTRIGARAALKALGMIK